MSKFKVGDKVIRTSLSTYNTGNVRYPEVKIGDILEVVKQDVSAPEGYFDGDEEYYFYIEEDFELVDLDKKHSLYQLVDNWFVEMTKLSENEPQKFLQIVENYIDSCDIEDVCNKLDNIRDQLEDLRSKVESELKPKFSVDKLHKLIKLVDVTVLNGKYYREGTKAESLSLNAKLKIRPPVDTHNPVNGDTFSIESIAGMLGGQELDYPAMIELLEKL